jgi:hypothetical protein
MELAQVCVQWLALVLAVLNRRVLLPEWLLMLLLEPSRPNETLMVSVWGVQREQSHEICKAAW